MPERVLVCGGRDFKDVNYVHSYLDHVNDLVGISMIIAGGARGADYWAQTWAETRNIPLTVFKADWDKYGKGAGPIRNQQMLDEGKPTMVIAFPGGKGTADMVKRSRKAEIFIEEIKYV